MKINETDFLKWATQVRAIDPKTGELCTFKGIDIFADSLEDAQAWVDNNAGFLDVVGYYDEAGQIVHVEKAIAA